MSTDRITLRLHSPQQGAREVREAWQWIKAMLTAGHRLTFTVRKETRSVKQNNLMWSCLTDLSKQVKWFGKHMEPAGWKDFITAHLAGQELVPNMNNDGFVVIGHGKSTSDMTIAEMTAVIDLCHAFGAEQNVQWSPTSLGEGATV
jgi:hypothetical protein